MTQRFPRRPVTVVVAVVTKVVVGAGVEVVVGLVVINSGTVVVIALTTPVVVEVMVDVAPVTAPETVVTGELIMVGATASVPVAVGTAASSKDVS